VLRHGGLSIDVEGRTATYAGTELPLTKIEFDLLTTMTGNPRRVWRRETLLNIVWGGQWSDHHVVEVHIGNLRRKLADVAGAGVPIIKTVRGIGYRMAPTDPAQSAGHHAGLPTTY
jgi:two-component system OmpR family response regulator